MDVQLTFSCLEVDIAERLQSTHFQLREFGKYTAIACETFEVCMALPIQIRAHLFDLKICHIAYASAQCAFMSARAAELKALNQAARRKHLPGCADDFTKAHIADENADNMSTAGNPDGRLVFLGFQFPICVYLKKLRM